MIPKFRVWDKDAKCYRDVEHINFISGNIVCDMGWADKAETQRWNALLKEGDYILEQSTGLFDKNGKEIFEGDIVKAYYEYDNAFELGQVYIEEEQLGFVIGREFDWNISGKDVFQSCEIIGNIHEDKHLLEDE